jgi:hypothetical protein
MNERQWETSRDPEEMLDFLRGKISSRKRRLFLCACYRRLQVPMTLQRNRAAVEASERYADGQGNTAELHDISRYGFIDDVKGILFGHERAAYDVRLTAAALATPGLPPLVTEPRYHDALNAEAAAQAELLRDIVGNPFRVVYLETYWLDWNERTVPALAKTIYDERAYDRLTVLADALEDAGCRDKELLGHCRGPGPHVRGCWVLDLILGKE